MVYEAADLAAAARKSLHVDRCGGRGSGSRSGGEFRKLFQHCHGGCRCRLLVVLMLLVYLMLRVGRYRCGVSIVGLVSIVSHGFMSQRSVSNGFMGGDIVRGNVFVHHGGYCSHGRWRFYVLIDSWLRLRMRLFHEVRPLVKRRPLRQRQCRSSDGSCHNGGMDAIQSIVYDNFMMVIGSSMMVVIGGGVMIMLMIVSGGDVIHNVRVGVVDIGGDSDVQSNIVLQLLRLLLLWRMLLRRWLVRLRGIDVMMMMMIQRCPLFRFGGNCHVYYANRRRCIETSTTTSF